MPKDEYQHASRNNSTRKSYFYLFIYTEPTSVCSETIEVSWLYFMLFVLGMLLGIFFTDVWVIMNRLIEGFFLVHSLLFLCLTLDVEHSSFLPFSMLHSPLSTRFSCEVRGRDFSLSRHTPPCSPRCLEEAQLGAGRSCAGRPNQ